jgi:ABC-2 type transport system ATP-binding protein
MQRLAALGVRSLTSQPPTLEELFLRHYGDVLGNDEGAPRSDDESAGPAS